MEFVSSINHLTRDDVPAQLIYASRLNTPITTQAVGIHHARFGQSLKERMDKLGIECELHTGMARGETSDLTLRFVKKHLGLE